MSGLNKVMLIGNVGKDPEVIQLDSGTTLVKFPLATSESFTDKDGNRVDQTTWHTIVMWRGLAQAAQKLISKGKQVYIEGKIKTRSYTDKDNATRYVTEIEAENFILLGKRDDSQKTENQS
ncbi:MAG: hypothetical protein KatS3mg034_1820 [Vicingaceae bacterium]|jgi:single-strand DNA-binding protein|nr:MAG: hypothetical protein KatS3mg034_1254 [Vicingaceae bacterium]GIV42510.1 MAG: hypothetical protein KatS3mg034_1820 [Vicingaceae bacterium]